MAKKTETKDETQKKASIYLDADFILESNTKIVSVSPAIDGILCGGIAEGVLMVISGPEKLGKTTLALTAIANAQKMGKMAIIADVEHRLRKKILTGIHGLDLSPDKLKIIRSTKGNILNAEKFLTLIEQSLHEYPESIVLIDSFSALSSSVEQTEGYEDKQMGGTGALQAKFCRRVAPIIAINGNIVIGIAHIASNIGTVGTSENIGRKNKYQLDIKVTCKKPFKANDKVDPDWYSGDTKIGHRIIWECPTNAIGTGGGTAVGYLRYGYGLDETAEIIDAACDLGIIKEGGAGWKELPNGKKIQGWENMYDFLTQEENKDVLEEINKSYRELIQ